MKTNAKNVIKFKIRKAFLVLRSAVLVVASNTVPLSNRSRIIFTRLGSDHTAKHEYKKSAEPELHIVAASAPPK
jgi:hypothetical protein